ncbi:MAG: DNA mismatch repair endonuclease MutL [Clostridia bacterium]|nr:DNA mismatch repair endonuclease MutL [Clostridia bacterium]
MAKINLLSFEVANLIAAGEVVDRPASAIKEMMENSIDAGARRITVEIQNGGITFMRVSDDGCGMEPEDLPLAIRRHATSKIETAADLDGICTLGFRGEALAAISAVSRVRIISKTRDAYVGAVLEVDCGEIISLEEQGCSDGTTIIVEDLFANVPARRKFLKRDVTETAAITASVERVALSHPEISFKLITDGQLKLETAGDGKLANAIYSVFGRDFATKLIAVSGEYEGIRVEGFVGRSDNVKGNRNYQNFYINNRYIKSKTASAALEQAFSSYLPSERFPVCVLFISMNPGRVDVNVHPAKLEVKFSNEKIVFESVYYAVKQALESSTARPQMQMPKASGGMKMSDSFIPVGRDESVKARQLTMDVQRQQTPPSVTVTQSGDGKSGFASGKVDTSKVAQPERISAKEYLDRYVNEIKSAGRAANKPAEVKSSVAETTPAAQQPVAEKPVVERVEKPATPVAETAPVTKAPVGQEQAEIPAREEAAPEPPVVPSIPWRLAGEVFNSYIIVEVGEKMLLVDKHAAHERIIYERLKANMYAADVTSQLLMLPIEIMLMSDEVSTIEEYRAEIEAVGFEFETGKNSVSVHAIPVGVEQGAVTDMFAVIADRIKNGTGNVSVTRNILFEKALYQASCKAAIKAGREYSDADNEWIIKQLMAIPDITVCPHGRPVAMELSKKNIDRQFERT